MGLVSVAVTRLAADGKLATWVCRGARTFLTVVRQPDLLVKPTVLLFRCFVNQSCSIEPRRVNDWSLHPYGRIHILVNQQDEQTVQW